MYTYTSKSRAGPHPAFLGLHTASNEKLDSCPMLELPGNCYCGSEHQCTHAQLNTIPSFPVYLCGLVVSSHCYAAFEFFSRMKVQM